MSIRVGARVEDIPELAGLGARIVARRKALAMGRRELARAAGLGESHVLNLEKGIRSDPSLSTIIRLCRALNISLDALACPSVAARV